MSENAFGKPAFDPSVGLHFSISHAGDRVMAAVSDAEVGCDVERIVPVDGEMLRAVLCDAERACLAALSDVARDHAFIRLWVRKESYIKAVGRGLDIDLSTFSALETPPASGWTWQDFDYGDGHLGCVCARLKRGADGVAIEKGGQIKLSRSCARRLESLDEVLDDSVMTRFLI